MKDALREFAGYLRGLSERPAAIPPERGEIYRELVRANLASLLRTQLPRTAGTLGESGWTAAIEQFLGAMTQRSPYFKDLAEEFIATLNADDAVLDLAHYEALQLEVETTTDPDPRRLAAYAHRVQQDPVIEGMTLLLLRRDAENGRVLARELSHAEYVYLASELGEPLTSSDSIGA